MRKRILVLMTVMALMVAMLAMAVAPAFAAQPVYQCTYTAGNSFFTNVYGAHSFERSCEKAKVRT
jgi:ABC-type sugar transport system substrate-binding protein